jgi:hypothetical protein
MEMRFLMKSGRKNLPEIWEGMHISMFLPRMPKELWVKKPTVQRDTEIDGKLVITYHYKEHDVIFMWGENYRDEELRIKGYFIQEIWEVEDVDES